MGNDMGNKKKKKPSLEELIIAGDNLYDGLWLLMLKRPWIFLIFIVVIVASIILLAKYGIIITDVFK